MHHIYDLCYKKYQDKRCSCIVYHNKNFKNFRIIYWLVCLAVIIVIAVRNWLVPFAHDEVATFFYYIQPGSFYPFFSHTDANGHFLMSATSWICFKVLGSSTFSLRFPCVISFVFLCVGVSRINNHLSKVFSKVFLTSFFICCFHFIAFFSLCRGYGISMAFLVLGLSYFFDYFKSKNEIIYVRYDDTNLKYVYLCAKCDKVWNTEQQKQA